jgi:hypothetical protein
VHVPVTGTPAVLSLLLSAMSTWDFHGVTCSSRADTDADIALVVRCDLLELSERSVLVCGRGDGRRGIVGGCSECARRRCVGDTVRSATRLGIVCNTHPSGVGIAVPGAWALATPALDIM